MQLQCGLLVFLYSDIEDALDKIGSVSAAGVGGGGVGKGSSGSN